MKKFFTLLVLLGLLTIAYPIQVCAQSSVSTYSTETYQDYDGVIHVYSSTRDDWYRVTLFFSEKTVTYIIEGRSPSVYGEYYHGTANCDTWIPTIKQYLDTVYGDNYMLQFGPNQLNDK